MLASLPYAFSVVITSRVFPDSAKLKGLKVAEKGQCL